MPEMRALSVRQPWAGAIMWMGKDVENRTRRMTYQGPLLIHSSLYEPEWHDFLPVRDIAQAAGHRVEWNDQRRTRGAILGVVEVTGCHHAEDCMLPTYLVVKGRTGCSPWCVRGQFHIELANPRPLSEPVPCRGALGLWRLPADVESAVRAQLARDVAATAESKGNPNA